jgi:formylglycine-generating enzyme required for sulfatase activity
VPPLQRGAGTAEQNQCTYLGVDDATNDDYPANCLSWATADLACRFLGKRLPTEAEWEYVAGNLGMKTQFPWGSDPAICAHAIVASGEFGEPYDCLATGSRMAGPAPLDVGADATELGVHDLAGNMSEWLADMFDSLSAPCWSGGGSLLVNPKCAHSSLPGGNHATRGGAWNQPAFTATASLRGNPASDGAQADIGFRCAISM